MRSYLETDGSPLTTRIKAGDPIGRSEEFATWLREHDLDPEQIYQINLLGDWMVVHQYAHDANGSKFVDKATGEVVVVEPFHVALRSDPPFVSVDETNRAAEHSSWLNDVDDQRRIEKATRSHD